MKSAKKLKTILCGVLLCFVAVLAIPGMTSAAATGKGVSLNKTQVTIRKGQISKIILNNVKNGVAVKWSSSKKSVATVKAAGSSCVVTAKNIGTAVITAKVGKKSYKCQVTVKKPVELSAKTKTIKKGGSFTLTLKNASSKNVKWGVSNKKIIKLKKVSALKYQVVGIGTGKAAVTVKQNGVSYKCTVTVKKTSNSSSSAKKKALKAYQEFLKSGYINIEENDIPVPKRLCKFALIYLDNDSIPELVINYDGMEFDNPWINGVLYSYIGGRIKKLDVMGMMDHLSYYKKKGVLADYSYSDLGGVGISYSRLNNGKYQNSLSASKIKKYVGNTKQTRVKFYKNTETNRQKYLKY